MTDEPHTEDEILDPGARAALERTQRKLVARVERLAETGGKKTVRHKCEACGTMATIQVDVENPEVVVRALSATSAALQRAQAQKGDDASEAATKLLRDRSGLTDEELAEYIARLEADLARDAES